MGRTWGELSTSMGDTLNRTVATAALAATLTLGACSAPPPAAPAQQRLTANGTLSLAKEAAYQVYGIRPSDKMCSLIDGNLYLDKNMFLTAPDSMAIGGLKTLELGQGKVDAAGRCNIPFTVTDIADMAVNYTLTLGRGTFRTDLTMGRAELVAGPTVNLYDGKTAWLPRR